MIVLVEGTTGSFSASARPRRSRTCSPSACAGEAKVCCHRRKTWRQHKRDVEQETEDCRWSGALYFELWKFHDFACLSLWLHKQSPRFNWGIRFTGTLLKTQNGATNAICCSFCGFTQQTRLFVDFRKHTCTKAFFAVIVPDNSALCKPEVSGGGWPPSQLSIWGFTAGDTLWNFWSFFAPRTWFRRCINASSRIGCCVFKLAFLRQVICAFFGFCNCFRVGTILAIVWVVRVQYCLCLSPSAVIAAFRAMCFEFHRTFDIWKYEMLQRHYGFGREQSTCTVDRTLKLADANICLNPKALSF